MNEKLHAQVGAVGNDQQQFFYLFCLGMFAHLIKRHDEIPKYPTNDLQAGTRLEERLLVGQVQLVDVVFDVLLRKNESFVKGVDIKLGVLGIFVGEHK